MSDYIELGPDEVIREGDKYRFKSIETRWFPINEKLYETEVKYATARIAIRPRMTFINDPERTTPNNPSDASKKES